MRCRVAAGSSLRYSEITLISRTARALASADIARREIRSGEPTAHRKVTVSSSSRKKCRPTGPCRNLHHAAREQVISYFPFREGRSNCKAERPIRAPDIFALGAMLYEVVTGRRAFAGKSQVSVMSAILEKDPDPISATQPLTPPALEHVINRALEKDPERRWQSAADLASELKWISESGSSVSRFTVPDSRPMPAGWPMAQPSRATQRST